MVYAEFSPNSIGATITRLVDSVANERNVANLPSGSQELVDYISKGLIPNLQGMFRDMQQRIDSETDPLERLFLKESRLVETIRLFTHPEIAQRIKKISEEINQGENNKVEIGLTIVGSAALGGLLVREAVGTDLGPWVDIDLIGSYALENQDSSYTIYEVMFQRALQIKDLLNSQRVKSSNSQDYQLCGAHSPDKMHDPVIESREEAEKELLGYASGKVDSPRFFHYFYPSYPDHHNALSRYYLLTALADIAEKQPETWEAIKINLITSFEEQIQPLKTKYFGKDTHDPIENELVTANQFFVSLFSDLISETGIKK